MGDENSNGKSHIGVVPMTKIASVCPAKTWDNYQKALGALADAKEVAGKAKEAVLVAMVTKLKLPNPELIGFDSNAERVRLFRRAAEKKQRGASLPDLTV